MERTYYLRGERQTLEEVENVLPLRAPGSSDAREALGTGLGADDLGVPGDALEAFRRAGWVFVRPGSESARLVEDRAPEAPPPTPANWPDAGATAWGSSRGAWWCSCGRTSPRPRRSSRS